MRPAGLEVPIVMKLKLLENLVSSIQGHSRQGRAALQNGNYDRAEECFLAAWDVIPEPKLEHDYAQTLSRGLVGFYKQVKQYDKALAWVDVMRKAYGPDENVSVEFTAATVHFDAGALDDAFSIFDKQFKEYGKRPFQGEHKKYLDFYLNGAAGNR